MANADLWKRAKEKHEQKKKEDEDRRGGFEQPLYSKLMSEKHSTKGYVQVRVLGLPKEFRNGDLANGIPADPTAPKTIYQSWVLADDMQKKFPVIWPSRDEKPDWILYKVMDKVLEGKWDASTNTKKYLNQETHSDLFLRVFKNNNLKNPYEKGWMPKGMVVMNVIDRQRMAEHKEKKHTFILSKASEGTDKEGKTTEYFDGGVSNLVYDSLMSVVGTCGDYNEYDIVVKRTEDKPYYAVYHGTEKLRFADFAAFNPKTIEAPLTEEELSWERYNIDKLHPVTSYKMILAKLRQFFVQVDKEFGTRYLDELIHLAEIEARETPKEEEKPVEKANVEAPKADPVSSAPVAGRRVAAPAPKNDEPEDPRIASLLEHGYKNAGKLTEENLDLIEYVDDSGEIVWVEGVGDLFECEACNTKTPGSVSHCPKCGAFFG